MSSTMACSPAAMVWPCPRNPRVVYYKLAALCPMPEGNVQSPLTHGKPPQSKCLRIHRSLRGHSYIPPPTEIQHRRTQTEHARWQEKRQPETDVSFCVDHAHLSDERAHINHQVEVEIDPGECSFGINNDSFAVESLRVRVCFPVLLCD